MDRRQLLQAAAGLSALSLTGVPLAARAQDSNAAVESAVKNGRIKQSVCFWCYKEKWSLPELAQVAKQLGCVSVELVDPKLWPVLKELGLKSAISSSHGFVRGLNTPENWPYCHGILRERIEQAAAHGVPNVITFTGMRGNLTDEEGLKNCVAGYKQIVGFAEEKGVTLCLEMLNSRDNTHPMKGHPGYQGDHVDYCIEIIKQVDSPRLKLLFDVYHVQIMDGDVIRRIRQYKDYIGHIHTAGNPGRCELDQTQEIYYPAVMQALLDVGYQGYVGHEFIPTRDHLEGLRQAVQVCDV